MSEFDAHTLGPAPEASQDKWATRKRPYETKVGVCCQRIDRRMEHRDNVKEMDKIESSYLLRTAARGAG